MVFAIKDAEEVLKEETSLFFDGTFRSCPIRNTFTQLHTMHVTHVT